MATVPPHNSYQSPPPGHQPGHQPGQMSQVHHGQYPQVHPGQSPHGQQYAPGQQPVYQTPPGHPMHQIPQTPQTHQPQSPQGQYVSQHQTQTLVSQPTYQSAALGPQIHQSPHVSQPGIPYQYAPGQQPNYQAMPYGVAAPPTPAQHQQQYQQQAAQFSPPPSASAQGPGQLQSTAQSLYKSGKGFLGNLASNIKSKYPAPSNAASTSSTTSYTGEAPKPTYNPAQHQTQSPLSPTNSFPQGYGQNQHAHSQHAPPTPQQSVSPGAPGYPPIPHQASFPQQSQGIPGQPFQGAQHNPQQLQQQLQPPSNGFTGTPTAIPQQIGQSPATASSPYPQSVLHHQQSMPSVPAPPTEALQLHPQVGPHITSPSHGQTHSYLLSPQQQHQNPALHSQQPASWPQQTSSGASYSPTTAGSSSGPTSQVIVQTGAPVYGPTGMYQQVQHHHQPAAPLPLGTTGSPHAAQLNASTAPYAQVHNPPQSLSPPQQNYQGSIPPSHQHQQQASHAHVQGKSTGSMPPATQPTEQPTGQANFVHHTQPGHQQHGSPQVQQPLSSIPIPVQQGAQILPGAHHSPYERPPSTVGAPATMHHASTPGENHTPLPSSPLQSLNQPSGILPSAPTAGIQSQVYSPTAAQQPLQTQHGQPPYHSHAISTNQQHHPQQPPVTHGQSMGGTHFASNAVSPVTMATGQNIQPYQPAQQALSSQQAPPTGGQLLPAQSGATENFQDPLASLSTQMSNLNVQNGHQQRPASDYVASHDQGGPRGPPPCQATGMVSDTLPYCPEDRVVTYALDWYRLAAVPQYLICTRCYADHVAGTPLAGEFERYHSSEGIESKCGFWSPRAREVWPQALQISDISPLRGFAEKSLTLPGCKGRVWTTANDGIKWWGMANNEVDGFISCETCYEDRVVGTAFESRFSPYRQQGPDEKWMCDLCIPYIAKIVVKMSKHNNWTGFTEAVKGRISLPVCEGRDEESNNGQWVLPRRKITNMTVCEACYLDKLALTPFGGEFERHQRAAGFDAFMESLGQKWKCSMTDTAVNMSIALEAALYRRDFDVFWKAANAICGLVPCTANGIIGGNWWTIAGGCPELDVCEACFKGVLETSNLERFFEPVQHDPKATIVCNFCPASPRWGMFITKFAEAIDKGVFSYYTDYVKKWAGVPTCPGIKNREKSKWWGHPEALACQDCWLNFVADTPLGESVPVKGVYDERPLICQLWSPRMRNMWLAACAAGPPGSPESQKALEDFRAFGTRRVQVYNATVPQIEMIQSMMMMKRMQAMQQGQLSLMYQGMNGMASIAGTTDGNWHGNSSVGYYETEHGVTAANMMNNMHTGLADANKMSDWMQIAQLKATWMEVE